MIGDNDGFAATLLFNRPASTSGSGTSLLSTLMGAAGGSGGGSDPDPDKLIYLWQDWIAVPEWSPNESGVCFACSDKLSLGSRHHCRLCGENFCSLCTGLYYVQKRFQRSKGDADSPARVCWGCRDLCLEKRDQLATMKQPRKKRLRIRKDNGKVYLHSPTDHAVNKSQCFTCRAQFSTSSSLNGPKPFTCRVCGEIVCQNCSSKSMVLPPSFRKVHFRANGKKKCRVCNECRYLIYRGAQIDGRIWNDDGELERARTVSSNLEDMKGDDDHSSDSELGAQNSAPKTSEVKKKGLYQQYSSAVVSQKLGLLVGRGKDSDEEEEEEVKRPVPSHKPEPKLIMDPVMMRNLESMKRSASKVELKEKTTPKQHARAGSLRIRAKPPTAVVQDIPEITESIPDRKDSLRHRSSSLGKIETKRNSKNDSPKDSQGAANPLAGLDPMAAKMCIIRKAVGISTALAQHDYDGKARGSMNFSKGDRLKVIKKGHVWWLAINLTNAPRIGWIPPNYVKEEEEEFHEPFPEIADDLHTAK
eukprot:TRINITY_DN35367_c0_g1_i1.p1 TRINITY_DN35367_c0_g1~~TRINITY_DN35367_c0_g1_i1.p1  ORF type:complete len:530 (+),score=95.27 TRINITY_DN35367_c0_g1_i1:87-1676(+)